MMSLVQIWMSIKSDRRGVTALEYAIIAGVLGTVLVTAFTGFGTSVTNLFTRIGGDL